MAIKFLEDGITIGTRVWRKGEIYNGEVFPDLSLGEDEQIAKFGIRMFRTTNDISSPVEVIPESTDEVVIEDVEEEEVVEEVEEEEEEELEEEIPKPRKKSKKRRRYDE